MTATALALAAENLVGTPFRLHGRDPLTGLDCIGVLAAALAATGRFPVIPNGYALRLADTAAWLPAPETLGFVRAAGDVTAGDAVLLLAGPIQPHLAIRSTRAGWVHAHAGLRRVVHQRHRPDGLLVQHWRLAPESKV